MNTTVFARHAARVLLFWTLWILAPMNWSGFADDGSASWRTGLSLWNGKGYDLPTRIESNDSNFSLPGDQPATVVQPNDTTAPYTVPIDPNAVRSNPYANTGALSTKGGGKLRLNGAKESPLPVRTPGAVQSTIKSQTPEPLGLPNPVDAQQTPGIIIDAPGDGLTESDALTSDSSLVAEPNTPSETELTLPPPIPEPIERWGKPESSLEQSVAAAPLEQEVVRWYQYPRRWMRGWNSHAEFGLDGSNGNSDTLALQTGLEMKRKTELDTWAIDIDYRQASSRNVTTEDNGRVNLDYDRVIPERPWSAFGKFGMEWDRFKPFDLRLNLDAGIGYFWMRQSDANLVTRFGAGANREIGAPIDQWTPEAIFGIDADRQLNSRNKIKAKIDYFPAWEDFNNYRLVSDFAWEILLDEADNLSLKLAVTDRYDSTPQGAKPNDVYYSLLLLYKF